jgi:hypothetical protein
MSPPSRIALFGFGVLSVLAFGCGGAKLPKTYAASGSVRYKGGQPMQGGAVQLTSLQDKELRVTGQLKEDGSFELETLKGKKKAAGAPEGEYNVLVIPPLEGDHKGVPPIALPGTRKIEAKENSLKIELPGPPPGR